MGPSIRPDQPPRIKGFNDYLRETGTDTLQALQTQKPDVSDTQNRIPSFSDYVAKFGESESGPFSIIGTRLANLWKLYKVSQGTASGEEYAQVGQRMVDVEAMRPGAMQEIGKRILNTLAYYGKKPPEPGEQPPPSILESIKGITAEGLAAGIPDIFTSIISKPIGAISGLDLDSPSMEAYTPEERAQAALDGAANVAMFVATAGAGSAVRGAYTASAASKLAKAADYAAIRGTAEKVAGGALKRALVTGTVEAGAGGATQAAVSRVGENDMGNMVLINGILFAPIGAAFERARYIGKSTDKLGATAITDAYKLQQLRQLQVSTKDSYSGVLFKLEGLENADNIAEAVLLGKLRATPDRPVVVPGITRDELGKVISAVAKGETKVAPSFYQRPDGTFDMLVGDNNKLSPTARRSFSETGFAPGQLIDVNGKTYSFSSLSKDGQKVNLVNSAGRSVQKERNEIRIRNDFETQDITPGTVGEQVYRDFKAFVMKNIPEADPTADVWDGTPSKSFDELLTTFAKDRGFNEAEIAVLERDFNHRLFQDTMRRLPDEERVVIEALLKEVEETVAQPGGSRLEQAQIAAKNASQEVIRKAASNGMYVDEEAAGNIVLRDAQADYRIGRFKTTKEAIEFIDKSGQTEGVGRLDYGNSVPFGSGLMPIPEDRIRGIDPPFVPWKPRRTAKFNEGIGGAKDLFNTVFDWVTPNRNILTSMDNLWDTRLLARVFDPVDVARGKYDAVLGPWMQELNTLNKRNLNLDAERRRIVGGYIETMSPAEIESRGGPGGRPLNELEIQLGRDIGARDVDLPKVQKYVREIERLGREHEAGRIGDETLKLKQLEAMNGFNMSEADLDIAAKIQAIKTGKVAWFGSVARLAHAIQNKDVTRAEYIKLHKMTGQETKFASDVESMFDKLAGEFNIPREYRLHNFMTHAAVYDKGNISASLRDFDVPPNVRDFYAALARTYETSAFEKDPVRALQRYLKAGFKQRIMEPVVVQAQNALKEELLKVPDKSRGKIKRVTDRYLEDVHGILPDASEYTQSAVDKLLTKLGVKTSVDVREGITNTIGLAGEVSTQGFRVMAGIRDFYSGVTNIFTFFPERLGKVLQYGVKGLNGIGKSKLVGAGEIPQLDAAFIETPSEFTASSLNTGFSIAGRGLRKAAQVGLKVSGQKDVYAMMYSGTYLATLEDAAKVTNQIIRQEITKQKGFKELKMDTYEPAVIKQFDELISNYKGREAAQFLARTTADKLIGKYRAGNSPGGWKRNIGRIGGQMGSWSMHQLALAREATARGTYGQRLAQAARFGASLYAVKSVADALDINLSNWYVTGAATYAGGPVVDATITVPTAIFGEGFEQDRAIGRLKRYLPYDPIDEHFNIGQVWVPGSFFIQDLIQAYEMSEQGDSRAPLRALGIRPNQ